MPEGKKRHRFTATTEEIDREKLIDLCEELGLTPMTEITPRTLVRVGGEVRSVRLVPRAGAPSLEVAITDGRGATTAVFLGRRKIAGIKPGRHIAVEGVAGEAGARILVFNPLYTLLP